MPAKRALFGVRTMNSFCFCDFAPFSLITLRQSTGLDATLLWLRRQKTHGKKILTEKAETGSIKISLACKLFSCHVKEPKFVNTYFSLTSIPPVPKVTSYKLKMFSSIERRLMEVVVLRLCHALSYIHTLF
jgi:hypothetical protein